MKGLRMKYFLNKNVFGMIVYFLIVFNISNTYGDVIKPEKITASSELTKYKGHLAKFASDGVVDGNHYWCSDFINKSKTPHWVEFDFGSKKKFNKIQLFMCEKHYLSQLYEDFKLEYWDGQKWKLIVEKKGYNKAISEIKSHNSKNRYKLKTPNPNPTFNFPTKTSSKVRLWIDKVAGGSARLREMIVSLSKEETTSKKIAAHRIDRREEGIYCFDFGVSEPLIYSEFIKVSNRSIYTTPKGYGWVNSDKIIECDRIYPNTVSGDFLVSESKGVDSVFKVNVPAGRYYVYMLSGDFLTATSGYKFKINDRLYEMPSYNNGDFLAETYVGIANKNGLEIKFTTPWLINAMVIVPIDKWQEILKINKSILLYKYLQDKYKEEKQPTHREKINATVMDKKQGYIPYVTSTQLRIFPDTTPQKHQIKDTVKVAATPGEFEPATFSIYGINNVEDMNVSISDLESSTEEIFPAKNVSLNTIRCWFQRSGHKGASNTYSFIPELLDSFRIQDVPANTSRQMWLTFYIPEDMNPGIYNGSIIITSSNLPEKKLKLKLNVYPFKLEKANDNFFAMYHGNGSIYYSQHKKFCMFPKNREIDLICLRDMKAHGMNSVVLGFDRSWQDFSIISEKLLYCNKILDEAGFPKSPIPLHHKTMTAKLATQVRDFVKKNNLREVLFYPVDEPFNGRLKLAIKKYKEMKTVDGIRTYSTVTQNDVDHLGKNLDVRTYTIIHYAKFEPERIYNECKKAGKSFWWYSNASREYPAAVRFKAGFFYWKTRSTGQAYWAYTDFRGGMFNDFDGGNSDHCVVYWKGKKLFTTIQWESLREGIDDVKYLMTLETAIKKYSNRRPEECKKARKLLEKIRIDAIDDLKEYEKHFGEQIAIHIKSFWKPEKYDLYRKQIAEQIIALQNTEPQ
jgi:hypothetical protein